MPHCLKYLPRNSTPQYNERMCIETESRTNSVSRKLTMEVSSSQFQDANGTLDRSRGNRKTITAFFSVGTFSI